VSWAEESCRVPDQSTPSRSQSLRPSFNSVSRSLPSIPRSVRSSTPTVYVTLKLKVQLDKCLSRWNTDPITTSISLINILQLKLGFFRAISCLGHLAVLRGHSSAVELLTRHRPL
jgi:hypothetical protein